MALSGTFYDQPYANYEFALKCVWEASQNLFDNSSTITLRVYLHHRGAGIGERTAQPIWMDTSKIYATILAWSSYPSAWTDKLLYTRTHTVWHDVDGQRSVYMSASYQVDHLYEGRWFSTLTASTTVTLDSIDRTAPIVNLVVSDITSTSIKLSATQNKAEACRWYYWSGTDWIYIPFNDISKTYTMTGLEPGTSYTVGIKAIRYHNGVSGESFKTAATLGISYPVAEADGKWAPFAIDTSTITLPVKWHTYFAEYYHSIILRFGAAVIASFSDIQATEIGTTNKNLEFSLVDQTAIRSNMSAVKQRLYSVEITTYSGAGQIGQIGNPTYINVLATTTAANSAPTITDASYLDLNTSVIAVTGSNQYILSGISRLRFIANNAVARHGASITGYAATFNNVTVNSATNTIDVGTTKAQKDTIASVTVYDSRGYSTMVKKNVTVIKYQPPSSNITVRRRNDVDNIITLAISGSISSVMINGDEKNALTSMYWIYGVTAGQWQAVEHFLSPTIDGLNYSFEDMDLTDSENIFDVGNSYNFRVCVLDKFGLSGYEVQEFLIPQSSPLMSFRPQKIGINKLNPTVALDVVGGLMVDGMDIVDTITGILELMSSQ